MSGIGGVDCSLVFGRPGLLQQETNTWSVPGIDSIGVHLVGKRGQQSTIRVVQFDSTANIETWIGNITDLVGQIVTVTDEYGITSSAQLVKQVSQPQRKPAIHEGGVRCEISVTLIAV